MTARYRSFGRREADGPPGVVDRALVERALTTGTYVLTLSSTSASGRGRVPYVCSLHTPLAPSAENPSFEGYNWLSSAHYVPCSIPAIG